MFTREILRCPVGKEVLGYRHKAEAAALECYDCNFTYVWEPNKSVPEATKIIPKKDTACGCGGCGR